jgi:phage-related holin
VAAVVVIYGLWQHSIKLILIGILIAVIGHIIQATTTKKAVGKEEKIKKKRK